MHKVARFEVSKEDNMEKNNIKMFAYIAGAAAGALSIIFSFAVYSFDLGSTEMRLAYGGDAYTGIQNAGAQSATNIYYLNHILRFGFFAILFVIGIVLLCHYVPLLLAITGNKAIKTNEANADNKVLDTDQPEEDRSDNVEFAEDHSEVPETTVVEIIKDLPPEQ